MSQKTKSSNSDNSFKFRRNYKIGLADAIEDHKFLEECFIDTGDLDIITDTEKPECILLGRTGAGKSALLQKIAEKNDRVISLSPENLAITYLSNNTALRFFMDVGINMDLFFQVLWRHIFAIELTKTLFDTTDNTRIENLLFYLRNLTLNTKTEEVARDYLLKYRDSYWQETDYRVQEFVEKLENDITKSASAVLSTAIPSFGGSKAELGSHTAEKLSTEQRTEVVNHGQRVVNASQIATLAKVIDFLPNRLLTDRKKKYYITIDRLDEKWVHDDLRYRLIRALIESVRLLNYKLPNVKIIITLRKDLLGRVFRYTRSSGDQEEKYEGLLLDLLWSEENLEKVLDKRINYLVKQTYTNKKVNWRKLVPSRVNKEDVFNFLVERTLFVPRDIISIFNECIAVSDGKIKVDERQLLLAEANYSAKRIRALRDEWSSDYPNLVEIAKLIQNWNSYFKIEDVDLDMFKDRVTNYWYTNYNSEDEFSSLVEEKIDQPVELLHHVLKILYKVGVVGMRKSITMPVFWSFKGHMLTEASIDEDSVFFVNKAFWRVLGVKA